MLEVQGCKVIEIVGDSVAQVICQVGGDGWQVNDARVFGVTFTEQRMQKWKRSKTL